MKSLVDALDRLKNACDVEATLRKSAALEWARGEQDGAMKRIHDAQINECIAAAQALVDLSQ